MGWDVGGDVMDEALREMRIGTVWAVPPIEGKTSWL